MNTRALGSDKRDRGDSCSLFTSLWKILLKRFKTKNRLGLLDYWHWGIVCFLDLNLGKTYWCAVRGHGRRLFSRVMAARYELATMTLRLQFDKPGYLSAKKGRDVVKHYFCKSSHSYGHCVLEKRKPLPRALKLSFSLLPLSMLICHAYLQLACAEYLGYRNTRYHLYLMPSAKPTQDTMCNFHGKEFVIFT